MQLGEAFYRCEECFRIVQDEALIRLAFFLCCCPNATGANQRRDSIRQLNRTDRAISWFVLVRGGPRNEPARPAADFFAHDIGGDPANP